MGRGSSKGLYDRVALFALLLRSRRKWAEMEWFIDGGNGV